MTNQTPDRAQLEPVGRLSNSVLWQLQSRYYQERGVSCWSSGRVPHHITSNPAAAEAYVELVIAYLGDLAAAGRLDPARPFPVVELAAGCGRFGFQFLRHWMRWARGSSRPLPPLRYLMTDLCAPNLDHLRAHPRLRPFVEMGLLDFAPFDATTRQPDRLTDGGPMVVVANYIFDTLPQESFVVRGGRLYQGHIGVTIPLGFSVDDPDVLGAVQVVWEDGPEVAATAVPDALSECGLSDALMANIVRQYQDRLPDTRFLLPVAALECLRHFHRESGNEMLALVGDKGDLLEWQLQFGDAPKIELHGSFSLPVNFHALGEYAAELGAEVFAPSRSPDQHVVTGYLFGCPGPVYPGFAHTYSRIIGRRGPDELSTIREALSAAGGPRHLDAALTTLALSNYDPAEFKAMVPALVAFGISIPDFRRPDLHRALLAVWDAYFWIGEPDDVAFAIGAVLCSIGYHVEAIDFYDRSVDLLGPEPGVLFSRALCQFHLRQLEDALKAVDAVLALDPDFSAARSVRDAITAELSSGSPSW